MNQEKIITIEPGKRGGKPCIRGMRITVYDVLENLASGMTEKEILKDFPDLTSDIDRPAAHGVARGHIPRIVWRPGHGHLPLGVGYN